MSTIEIKVQRFSLVSSRSFEEVLRKLTATIGHPDMNEFHQEITNAKTFFDLENVVHRLIGSSELMEFIRFDSGEVLSKEQGGTGPHMLRLVVGNPIIMKVMAKSVPDAASYAPSPSSSTSAQMVCTFPMI